MNRVTARHSCRPVGVSQTARNAWETGYRSVKDAPRCQSWGPVVQKTLSAAGFALMALVTTTASATPVWRHYPPPGEFPAPPPRVLPTPPEILRTYDGAASSARLSSGLAPLTPLPDVGPAALSPLAPTTGSTPALEPIEAMPALPVAAAQAPTALPAGDTDAGPATTAAIAAAPAETADPAVVPVPAAEPAVDAAPPPAPPSATITLAMSSAATPPAPAAAAPPAPSVSEAAKTEAVPTATSDAPTAPASAQPWPGILVALVVLVGAGLVVIGRRRMARG